MSKSVNVDFVTRQIEVDTDGKEHFISAAMAAKDAEQSMLNAQNAANHAEAQADSVKKYKALWFKSVAAMKAEPSLTTGAYVNTAGYYAPNDGGGASYLIRAKAASDTDDGSRIHALQNGLVAELIIENGAVNVKQFGAVGDGVTDDADAIQRAIDSRYTTYIPVGNYLLSKPILVRNVFVGYSEEKAQKGKCIRASVGTKFIAQGDFSCIIVQGFSNYVENLILTFKENVFNYSSPLLFLDAITTDNGLSTEDNLFVNITCCTIYNPYLITDRKFKGIGIQLKSNGDLTIYKNKFIGCLVADLQKGIVIDNGSSAGINANYFNVNVWNCNYGIITNGNGNTFIGSGQAMRKLADEDNYCITVNGKYNEFYIFFWDVYTEDTPLEQKLLFLSDNAFGNSFSQIAAAESVDGNFYGNNIKFLDGGIKINRQDCYVPRGASAYTRYPTETHFPTENSLRNSGVTDMQIITENATITGNSNYPIISEGIINASYLKGKNSNSRAIKFTCTDNAKIKIRFTIPNYSILDNVYLFSTNDYKKPKSAIFKLYKTSYGSDTALTYEVPIANLLPFPRILAFAPKFNFNDTTYRFAELELTYDAGNVGYSYISAFIVNAINGPLCDDV